MSEEIWETGAGVKIHLPNGETVERTSVTAEDIKSLARNAGLKKFTVENADGEILGPSEFPLETGEIKIKEYNEAK